MNSLDDIRVKMNKLKRAMPNSLQVTEVFLQMGDEILSSLMSQLGERDGMGHPLFFKTQ